MIWVRQCLTPRLRKLDRLLLLANNPFGAFVGVRLDVEKIAE